MAEQVRYNMMMTQQMVAMTLTLLVKQWLKKPTAVSLLHLFDQAINLMDADGEIISIVQPAIGAQPFALMVDWDRPFTHEISPNDPISKTPTSLQIGSLQIDINQTEVWNPRPKWELLHQQTAVWQPHLPILQTAVTQNQHRLTEGSPPTFAQKFVAATDAAQRALWQHDLAGWQTAVAQLAGLGPGLTPAGDDYLLGLLLGLWATRPATEVGELVNVLRITAVPRTTKLSAAWLKAAANGEATARWHELLAALLSGDDLETAVTAILNTGATSGIAALIGFAAATTNGQVEK